MDELAPYKYYRLCYRLENQQLDRIARGPWMENKQAFELLKNLQETHWLEPARIPPEYKATVELVDGRLFCLIDGVVIEEFKDNEHGFISDGRFPRRLLLRS